MATAEKDASEYAEVEKISDSAHETGPPIDKQQEKKLIRKIDLHLIPILFVMLMAAFLDRINIGNARIMGMERDLNMSGNDFNIALFMFFIPYILCELPSNLVLKKVRPSIWLSGLAFCWGLVTTFKGFTQSFAGLVVCRVLIGAFEAGFFPGAIYLISMYYKRFELQLRVNVFFSASVLAGALSGLLAYGIGQMEGVRGYSAWRWIFLLEGCATCVLAVAAFFIIPDWPQDAKFLNEEEKRVLIQRLAEDAGDARMDKLDKKAIRRAFLDIKIYLGVLIYIGVGVASYSVSFFTPTILYEYGFGVLRTQVLVIPIFLFAGIATIIVAMISDKVRHRYSFAVAELLTSIIGFAILLNGLSLDRGVRYMAIYFVATGAVITQPIAVTWINNNMGGHYKRSVAAAVQIGLGNCAGFIASNVYITSEAPIYRTGYSVGLALICLSIIASTCLLAYMFMENKKRDQGGRDYRLQLPPDELSNLGDDHPSFRFSY